MATTGFLLWFKVEATHFVPRWLVYVAERVHFYEAVQRLQLDVERVVPMHGRVTSFDEVRRAVETFGKGQLWSN